uniref:Chemokine interleukin-8-like domain-containing protein n=1 Tax=Sander lucioperca TaxID=283035 RepID=A0A8C9Y6B4_SANLU
MKSLVALALLICFLIKCVSVFTGPVALSISRNGCCPGYSQQHIPRTKVIHVAMTPEHCGAKAIVVTAVKHKFCIDPQWKWAKDLLAEFQNSSSVISKPQKSEDKQTKV